MDKRVIRLYQQLRKESHHGNLGFKLPDSRLPALTALTMARDLVRIGDLGYIFVWQDDPDGLERGDFPDSASALNHCAFEHGGEHGGRRSHIVYRRGCGNAGGRGHFPGELKPECCYFNGGRELRVSSCALVKPCERHEGESSYDWDPWTCKRCEIVDDLHGIDGDDWSYFRDVESGMAAALLGDLDATAAAEWARTCARGLEMIGKGI
jgi:hypothetical protein